MPANKTIQVSVRLTEEDIAILDEYCEKNDLKRAFVIRLALREYLEKQSEN
jgi:metal-responsive CopG/Arc/MetJ family transcriptional regulator